MIEYHEWHGLYRESWGKTIVPAAYAHPAKFRPALIRCIYAHLLEQGYLQAGQVVLDPFAGVALGALHAMQNGLVWLGVELEERFVNLGQQNIDLWNRKYGTMPSWGQAAIFQGDSRHLCEVLAGAGVAGAVSSPPYATLSTRGGQLEQRAANLEAAGFDSAKWLGKRRCTQARSEGYGTSDGQLASLPVGDAPQVQAGAVVSSMPYAETDLQGGRRGGTGVGARHQDLAIDERASLASGIGYGTAQGNLGNLPAGEPPAAVVSSMPFTNSLASDDPDKRGGLFRDPRRRGDRNMTGEYGATKGQLGAMAEGQPVQVQGSVSSPPYADQSIAAGSHGKFGNHHEHGSLLDQMGYGEGYSHSEDNLGNSQGTTFWSASAEIMRQVYQVLAPGAVAVWVCKAFVRKGALVDFPGQWQALGESCGFETIEVIRAWLVEDNGAQWTLENGLEERRIERKSFFRLLSERRARAQKYWQSVPRADQARYLWQARHDRWDDYKCRWFVVLLSILLNGWGQIEMDAEALAERLGVLPDEISDKPTCPTRNSIIHTAQMTAYTEAGMPQIEIETAIDYEVVLIQRKVRNE